MTRSIVNWTQGGDLGDVVSGKHQSCSLSLFLARRGSVSNHFGKDTDFIIPLL